MYMSQNEDTAEDVEHVSPRGGPGTEVREFDTGEQANVKLITHSNDSAHSNQSLMISSKTCMYGGLRFLHIKYERGNFPVLVLS